MKNVTKFYLQLICIINLWCLVSCKNLFQSNTPVEISEDPNSDSLFFCDFSTSRLPGGVNIGNSGSGSAKPVIKDGVMTINVKPMQNGSTSYLTLSVSNNSDLCLSYKFYVDTWPGNNNYPDDSGKFRVYVDDVRVKEYNDRCTKNWETDSVIVPSGNHTIKFVYEKTSKWIGQEPIENVVKLDDLSLVFDVVTGVKIIPRANQETYIGCQNYEKIVAKGYAVRADGSIKSDAKVTLSATGGTINSKGMFTPNRIGTTKIIGTCGNVTGESGEIIVYDSDYKQNKFMYNGKTYNGIDESTATGIVKPSSTPSGTGKTEITYPTYTTFNADGFFTLEGTVNNPNTYNYALVQVYKGEALPSSLQTYYLIRDDFSIRIWLRFGKGEYTVKVLNITEINLSDNLGAEGDYIGFSGGYATQEFTVTNTRAESAGGESDGKWIYPSYVVQSDDLLVRNTTAEVLYDLSANATDRQKIKAIHDYIVTTKYYDEASLVAANRKKQDAVSVLKNGTAVCEGYANTVAAMARYAGIPARYVSGKGVTKNGSEAHGWNNVYIGGKWLFLDATWDDPLPDGYLLYDYFLLETLDGINGDHIGNNNAAYGSPDIKRSVIFDDINLSSVIPEWRGTPGGWY